MYLLQARTFVGFELAHEYRNEEVEKGEGAEDVEQQKVDRCEDRVGGEGCLVLREEDLVPALSWGGVVGRDQWVGST